MSLTVNSVTWIALLSGVLALLFAAYHAHRVNSEEPGTERMKEISGAIHEGAMAFLASEYKIIAIVVVLLIGIIVACGFGTGNGAETLNPLTAIPYVIGAFWLVTLVCVLLPKRTSELPTPLSAAATLLSVSLFPAVLLWVSVL